MGTVIGKVFEGGRRLLAEQYAVPVESLVVITDMGDGQIIMA